MWKIQILAYLLAITGTLAQVSETLPLPLNFKYTVNDFPFQLGSEEEGTMCTWSGYCVFWTKDDENCYTYIDTNDNTYYECFDDTNQHLSGVQTYARGYTIQYERQASGYLFWDSANSTWYESFNGDTGYYVEETEFSYYYEEWHTSEEGTYTYWNSDGEEIVEYAAGHYYEYYPNGDIQYYDALYDKWFYYSFEEDLWYEWNSSWNFYQKMEGEPEFFTWESSFSDLTDSSSTTSEDVASWQVNINSTALASLIEDVLELETMKVEIIESTAQQLMQDLADSYQRLLGEIIINFGKTVVPIGDAEMEFYRYTVVNEDCNMTCGSDCFDPTADETLFMNVQCMDACGCYFRIQNMTESNITDDVVEYGETLQEGAETYGKILGDVLEEITPSIEQFMEMKDAMMQEYAEKLLYHAVNTFACEETCSQDCTDIAYYYPLEMIPCLVSWCDCSETPIEIVPSDDFDLSYLEQYAGDADVWQYFLANKNRFSF